MKTQILEAAQLHWTPQVLGKSEVQVHRVVDPATFSGMSFAARQLVQYPDETFEDEPVVFFEEAGGVAHRIFPSSQTPTTPMTPQIARAHPVGNAAAVTAWPRSLVRLAASLAPAEESFLGQAARRLPPVAL